MLPDILLPCISTVQFIQLELQSNQLLLKMRTDSKFAVCPSCSKNSKRVHSRYFRLLSDLPWAGIEMKIHLQVRRFFCEEGSCNQKFFTERLDGLKSHCRRTNRFTNHLLAIGMKTGGNAGAKLANSLGIPTSATTILRILHGAQNFEFETPRILGVDDWAFLKGRKYGTILVDLEKQRPIELLPDRQAETLEKWLNQHPGVEIISRDRASAYSEGASKGAPNALQVADRWHLLKNITDAVKRLMDKHHHASRKAAKEISEIRRAELMKEQTTETEVVPILPINEEKENAISKYELMFKQVKELQKQKLSQREIHRRTGIHRCTIAKYFQYDEYPKRSVAITKVPKAAYFDDYLAKRWTEGEQNCRQLWRELKEKGFNGSYNAFLLYMKKNYNKKKKPEDQVGVAQLKAYSARRLSYLLVREPDKLKEKEIQYLEHLFNHCPEAKLANKLTLRFKDLLINQKANLLDSWLEEVINGESRVLKNFAKGLQQDYEAVKNACSMQWSNGQVEGQVNRLKNIKRQMYGRAGFQLLRKRVLFDSS